jgi:hypothetical protein
MPDTFTSLMLSLDMTQALANVRHARVEIVREDGSVVVAVDPEEWQEQRVEPGGPELTGGAFREADRQSLDPTQGSHTRTSKSSSSLRTDIPGS